MSYDDAQHLTEGALRELFNTHVGHRILIEIASQGNRQNIILNTNGVNNGSFESRTVNIDVAANPDTILGSHNLYTPLSVALGHEFGHSVFKYNDLRVDADGLIAVRDLAARMGRSAPPLTDFQRRELPLRGDNVQFVENPLRLELGLEQRKSYVSDYTLRRWFPEIFK